MVAYRYTIPADICGKVEEYLRKKFRGDEHVFIHAMFDDEILFVADSRNACRGITSDIETICEYEGFEMKHDILKAENL